MAIDPSLFLAGGSLISSIGNISSGILNYQSAQIQGQFQKQMYEINKRLASFKAEDALLRGSEAVTEHKRGVKQFVGRQRAALAAQGISVDAGSALQIQENTASMGALDALKIKNNAVREAWGYKTEAISFGGQGTMAQLASANRGGASLATGITGGLGSLAEGAYYYYGGGKK